MIGFLLFALQCASEFISYDWLELSVSLPHNQLHNIRNNMMAIEVHIANYSSSTIVFHVMSSEP